LREAASAPDGADGGVDVVLRRDGESYLCQCKHSGHAKSAYRWCGGFMGWWRRRGLSVVSSLPAGSSRRRAGSSPRDGICSSSMARRSPRWTGRRGNERTREDHLAPRWSGAEGGGE